MHDACSPHINIVILLHNVTYITEMDVDYLVVEDMLNISKLVDYT
jgi:hypothetical protein